MSERTGYIDKNKLLASLTEQDIIKIITALGSNYKKDSKGNICCSTSLCHGGDSPYKLVCYLDEDVTLFKCYTCGDAYDIVSLVIRAFRNQGSTMSYYKALRWIAATTGKINVYGRIEIKKPAVDFGWINKLKRVLNKEDIAPNKVINENVLDVFTYYPYKPWTEEHISYKAMERFEIGYYGLNNSVTIPHRNGNGELIGVRQRYLDQEDIERIGKYTPVQISGKFLSHSLGNELYGLWVCKDKIKESHTIILVEAEKSCLQGYSYYNNSSVIVACCGSSITIAQQRIINDLQVETLIYAPDRDYQEANSFEAEAWYQTQVKKLQGMIQYCSVYLVADRDHKLGLKQSPTDCGKEVFEELLKDKIQITKEEADRVLKQ